jgi:2-aminoadipate transaminase
MTAYGTAVGYVPLRRWIAERHGVEPEQRARHQRLDAGGRVPVRRARRRRRRVIVERPSYDRTLLSLRQRGAALTAIALEPDGIDTEALAAALANGVRPTLAHIIPNFQNPAGYTLSGPKRERLLELAREHNFTVFEDDPYVALRFSGETLPTMLSIDDPERRRLRLFVLQDGLPRHPRRLSDRAGRADFADRRARDQHLHLAEHGRRRDRLRVLRLRRDRPFDRAVRGALEERVDDARSGARARGDPRCVLRRSRRRLLPVGESSPPAPTPAAVLKAAAERGLALVSGDDFVLDGGSGAVRLAYSGVTPDEIREGVTRLAAALAAL